MLTPERVYSMLFGLLTTFTPAGWPLSDGRSITPINPD
jgi:hypothetical protein